MKADYFLKIYEDLKQIITDNIKVTHKDDYEKIIETLSLSKYLALFTKTEESIPDESLVYALHYLNELAEQLSSLGFILIKRAVTQTNAKVLKNVKLHFKTDEALLDFLLDNQAILAKKVGTEGLAIIAADVAVKEYDAFINLFHQSTPITQAYDDTGITQFMSIHLSHLIETAMGDNIAPNKKLPDLIRDVKKYMSENILKQSALHSEQQEYLLDDLHDDIADYIKKNFLTINWSTDEIIKKLNAETTKKSILKTEKKEIDDSTMKPVHKKFQFSNRVTTIDFSADSQLGKFIEDTQSSPYKSLQISPDASDVEIKTKYIDHFNAYKIECMKSMQQFTLDNDAEFDSPYPKFLERSRAFRILMKNRKKVDDHLKHEENQAQGFIKK